MKSVKFDLPEEFEKIEIHIFADLHIGDPHCDLTGIRQRIEYVKNTPNAFAVLNGDIINCATKNSVSDVYGEQMDIMGEMSTFISLFDCIKDKIICACSGNHEARTFKSDGIDLTYVCMKQMGIQDRYAPEGIVAILHFGMNPKNRRKNMYTMYMTHGFGGGKRIGGKANRLEDLTGIISTDIYIHSHTHAPMVFKGSSFNINPYNGNVYQMEHLFVNSSAMLDYGGYGQTYGFRPASKACPVIYLYAGNKKRMEALI